MNSLTQKRLEVYSRAVNLGSLGPSTVNCTFVAHNIKFSLLVVGTNDPSKVSKSFIQTDLIKLAGVDNGILVLGNSSQLPVKN